MLSRWVAFLCFTLVIIPFSLQAREIYVPDGGGTYDIETTSLHDYKFRDVIRQQRDFSCGSAALATLLSYHYNRKISETEVLHKMYEAGDKKKIKKEGFSLLDMKSYLATLGLTAEGYKESLDKLEEVKIPAIALINLRGYLHFVLIRGLNEDEVLLADPANGSKRMSRKDFEAIWNNILFVVLNDTAIGKQHFNLTKHWGQPLKHHTLKDLLGEQDLAPLSLHLTRQPGYF